jgi:C_GCAxxG_C_C family probable redox protein
MDQVARAESNYQAGFNCSQAVFAACCRELGLDEETALRIASTFGGGLGRCAETCGAVTGGLMVLGLQYGSAEATREAKERAYRVAHQFILRFKAEHHSITCRELMGVDISTPDGLAEAQVQNLSQGVCLGLVRSAAALASELVAVEPPA